MKKLSHNPQPTTHNQRKPLVSVIMPVYNAGEFLVEAIESIRNQTVTDWELLAIDDASTDESLRVLRNFAKRDKRIKVYRNVSHKMIGASLNSLLLHAKGKYIARMDADDVSLPDRFTKQIKYLESHREIVACGGSAQMIDVKGRAFAEKRFPTDPNVLYQLIMRMVPVQHPILMARGRVMRKCRYDETMTTAEDVDMFFQLLQKGRLGNVPDIIYQYRKSQTSNGYHNVKRTFYLTLLCRLNAIIDYEYRPTLTGIVQTMLETLVVTILPSKWVVNVYEWYRYHRMRHDGADRGIYWNNESIKISLAKKIALS